MNPRTQRRSGPSASPAVVAVSLCAVTALAGCGKKVAPTPKVPSDTVALVGDRAITQADLDGYVQRLPEFARASYASPERRRQLLDSMIRTEVLTLEAERRGHDKDPEHRRAIKQQLVNHLLQRALEGRSRPEDVSDADAERYYQEHAREFVKVGEPRISQIVVADAARAMRVREAAQRLGKDDTAGFQALVARHSIDATTRAKGGELVGLSPTNVGLPQNLVGASFALQKPGDLSQIIQTEQGFHLLRLIERQGAQPRPFAEVKDEVRQRLLQEWREKKLEELLAEGRKRFETKTFPERLAGASAGVSVAASASASASSGTAGR